MGLHDDVNELTTLLRQLLDICTQSMDFGSGFLDDDDVEAMRRAAEVVGIDPLHVTQLNFRCRYTGEHEWTNEVYGNFGGANGDWYCRSCQFTSRDRPTDGTIVKELGYSPPVPTAPAWPPPGTHVTIRADGSVTVAVPE